MKNTITAVLMAATAAVSVTATPVVELESWGNLAFKLQWYRDNLCHDFVGEYDYNNGGIFHSGDTNEGCKNVPLTDAISAQIIAGQDAAYCQLFVGPNCSGQQLAYMTEGTGGQLSTLSV